MLTVGDHGIGVPEGRWIVSSLIGRSPAPPCYFRHFWRGSPASATYIARQIVQAHGGTIIQVSNQPGARARVSSYNHPRRG